MGFLGAGTLLCGTVDGCFCVSAGATGFQDVGAESSEDQRDSALRLHQRKFQAGMVRQFNFGGHFGCVNRVFVAEQIAPLLRSRERPERAQLETSSNPLDSEVQSLPAVASFGTPRIDLRADCGIC